MITLLKLITERNPRKAGWRCCLCDEKLSSIEHADEGLTGCEDFTFTGIVDRLYCSECADCEDMELDDYCDCCYAEVHEQVETLGDPVLIEATRKVLGLDS
jgi:hypothetical protein